MITADLKERSGLNMYNRLLVEHGMDVQMIVSDDPDFEGLYELSVSKGDKRTPMTNGMDEDELADCICETFNELLRYCYVVTYVGLSDSDADANGYCAAIVCANRKIAEDKVTQLIKEEEAAHEGVRTLREEGRITLSWAGGSEKVVISIHETRKEWV